MALAGVAGAAVVALVAAFGLSHDRDTDAPVKATSGTISKSATSPAAATGSAGSSSTGSSAGSSKGAATGSAGSSAGGPSDGQTPLDKRKEGSEQPTDAPTARAQRLPGLHPAKPLTVTVPARNGSATGRLVTGFPSSALPLPAGAQVKTSSMSSAEGRVRVDVVAQTELTDDGVLAFYARRLAPKGLIGATVPAVAGSRAQSFSDGRNSVTVTVEHHAERRTIIVTAVLRRAG